MKSIFGRQLEGCPLPTSIHGLHKIVVGPGGFLELLEMRLGLPPVFPDELARLQAFRNALAECSDGTFYAKSFALDPFGSARVLLRWRDDLRVAGWNARVDGAPDRLADLAKVETVFTQQEAGKIDTASRLHAVSEALKHGADPGFEPVELIDSIFHFPLRWREVLENLPVQENAWQLPEKSLAPAGTQLHEVQSRLLGNESNAISPDGTVRIFRSTVVTKNAQAAAIWMRDVGTEKSTAVIGNPIAVGPLDSALQNLDQPRTGSSSRSSAGSVIQLAPLLLNLHWGPFNPQAWLEFFLHPVSPLSRRLAGKMARTLQATPARANPAWQAALDEIVETTDDSNAKKRLGKQISDWFSPTEFGDDADPAVLAETLKRLSGWSGKRGGTLEGEEERITFLAASRAFARLANVIADQPKISREDLDRLVAEWLGTTSTSSRRVAELGAHQRLRNPSHLLDPVDHVIWWQPAEKSIRPGPWSSYELAWLSENGAVFADPERCREAAQADTLRAILNARESITIFTTPETGTIEDAMSPIVVRLLAECGDAILAKPESVIETCPVDRRPLPAKRREWISHRPDLLTPREGESFSSLHQFIYSPWQWVLRYKARLRPGRVFEFRIVDDAKSQGSLLHGFVESLLEPEPDPLELTDDNLPGGGSANEEATATVGLLETLVRRLFDESTPLDWRTVSEEAVKKWIEEQWDDSLAAHAAQYLVAGNEASQSELLYLAKNGIWNLIHQLHRADIVRVTCEERLSEVPFFGGLLGGMIDLRVENSDGEIGVIDLKLGGKSNRRDELARGRHLQLSTYGYLVKAKHSQTAHCAYFIFSGGGTLLARSNEFFRGADIVASADGVPVDDWNSCWNEFETLWHRRRAELDTGNIEVTLSEFWPRLDPDRWKIKEPEKYSPFLNLVGWNPTD